MSLKSGQKLGNFRILNLLGKGGMGEVYLARDDKLGRDVAIKVLPESFAADSERLGRFEREAQTLAALNHLNVATMHGFEHDEGSGVHYLVMEHIDGETLGERISQGVLSLSDVLPLFIDIARGLDAAHDAGIVHRDLKPDNVKISEDGVVKILDFGIAKRTAVGESKPHNPNAPTTPRSPVAVTAEGTFMGTPVYMSPEQARGNAVDKRTDIWAFGCCLYEALTGKLPFEGDTVADTVGAIMEKDPDWNRLPIETPDVIRLLLQQCLEKNSRERLSGAGDIAISLANFRENAKRELRPEKVASTVQRKGVFWWGMGIVIVLLIVTGAVILRTSDRSRNAVPISDSDTIRDIRSLAVLPFYNLMGDPEQEYFVDGMTDALSAELSKISSLKVISPSSAMRYKGTDKSIQEIAKELGVDGLVGGSIQRSEEDVRITARLIHGRSDEHMWGNNFTGTMDNIFELQSKVAREIVSQIQVSITPEDQKKLEPRESVNSKAVDAYLLGNFYLAKRTNKSLEKATEHFSEAIKISPNYAEAYVGLADAHVLAASRGLGSGAEHYPDAIKYVEKALALNSRLGEAHATLGQIAYTYDRDWERAGSEFRTAIAHDPVSVKARSWYSFYLALTQSFEEAKKQVEVAVGLSPVSPLIRSFYGQILIHAEDFDEALEQFERMEELDPFFKPGRISYSRNYAAQGDYAMAISITEKLDQDVVVFGLAHAAWLAANGDTDEAWQILQRWLGESESSFSDPFHLARVYWFLGKKNEAFELINKAVDDYSLQVLTMGLDPSSAPLWKDPRFEDVLRRLNYPKIEEFRQRVTNISP